MAAVIFLSPRYQVDWSCKLALLEIIFPLLACQLKYFFKKTTRVFYFGFIPDCGTAFVIVSFKLH